MASAAKRIIRFVLIVTVMFAVAEGVLRLVRFAPVITYAFDVDGAPLKSFYILTPDGPRMRPSARSITIDSEGVIGSELRTNSLGLRGGEPKSNRSTPRVLFLGDSVTFAAEVSEEESFVGRLQKILGPSVELLNGGVSGLSLAQERRLLLEVGPTLKPDVVVLNFYLNDAAVYPVIVRRLPPGFLRWSWFVTHMYNLADLLLLRFGPTENVSLGEAEQWVREIAANLSNVSSDHSGEKSWFMKHAMAAPLDWGSAWSDSAWVTIEGEFSKLVEDVEGLGAQLKVVVHPVQIQLLSNGDFDQPQQRMIALGAKHNVSVYDLLPEMRKAYRSSDAALHFDHCHLTAKGHQLVANSIAPTLSLGH